MAVQNKSSQIITDLDASPVVKTNQLERGAALRSAIAHLSLTAAEVDGDAGSVWRMLRIPARARVERLEIINDDLEGATPTLTVNIGLYEVDGGAAKDADFFASAVDTLQGATTSFQDLTYESGAGVLDLPKYVQALWEQLGDADTPENRGKEYDIAFTVANAAGSNPQAGDIVMRATYALFE